MHKDVPQVSVIIPAYNCEAFVARAVQSVLDQQQASEIMVVDDGSSDRSGTVLESFGDRIRLIRQKNTGVAGARNTGMREARGEFIAFLDADDWWEPLHLAIQLAAFERFPAAGMVFSDFSVADTNGSVTMPSGIRWKYQAVRDPGTAPWARLFSESAQVNGNPRLAGGSMSTVYCGQIFARLFQGNFINTSSVLLRRQAAERAGEFSLALDTEEDYDYWLRVSADWPLIYVDAPLLVFRKSPTQLTRADQIGRVAANALKVVEMASERYADRLDSADIGRRMARLHASLGVIALRHGDRAEARKRLVSSLRYRPWWFVTQCLYVMACLPPSTFQFMEQVRRRVRN